MEEEKRPAPRFCYIFTSLSFGFGIAGLCAMFVPFLNYVVLCGLCQAGFAFGVVALIVGVGVRGDAAIKTRAILGVVFNAVAIVISIIMVIVYWTLFIAFLVGSGAGAAGYDISLLLAALL